MGDVQWGRPLLDHGSLDLGRVRMQAPREPEVGVHPRGQADLALVDEDDAVGATTLATVATADPWTARIIAIALAIQITKKTGQRANS